MLKLLRATQRIIGSLSIVLLPLFFTAACGLGMDNAERLERGQAAFEESDYRAAIIDAKTILQQEPENREARLLLGRASLRANDAATAEKELRRAVKLGADFRTVAVELGKAMLLLRQFEPLLEEIQPELAQNDSDRLAIFRLRGNAMMRLERPVPARDLYLAALAVDSEDLKSKLGVVSSYAAEENYSEARKVLDSTLEIDSQYVPSWLASGSLYLAVRDADGAADSFSRALELAAPASNNGGQITALNGLVEARLAQRDLAAAKAAAAQLQALAPDHLSTLYLAARIAYLEKDYETAQAKLQQVLSAAPESRPAEFLMGAVHLQRGNPGQAEMYLSSVVAAVPDHVEARKLLAEIRLRQDRAAEAADILQPVLDSANADVSTMDLAVRASIAAGEYQNAIEFLRQGVERNPDNVELQLDLATAYLAAGQVDDAERLLKSPPNDTEKNAYRRDLLTVIAPLRRGDAASAMTDARAMAERWPDDARVRSLIGNIALSMDRPDFARESFLAARKLAPAELSTYINVARIDLQRGDLDAAREQYRAALLQQPKSVPTMVAMAGLEARLENRDAAVQWLLKARAADPEALKPRLLLARFYVGEGDFQAAEKMASEAIRLDASSAAAQNVLGLAQQGLGENAAALASFEQATELDPEQSAYRMNQARAQMKTGDLEAAEQSLWAGGGIDLDDVQASVMTAALKARQGDAEAAMKIAKDLQSRHPGNAIPVALEAELLAAGQKYSQSARVYDRALALGTNDRRLALRAFRVRSLGKLDDPLAPLLDYLDERPLDAELWLVVAQDYQARGESERAIAAYEHVLSTAPDTLVALNNLAWEYFQKGDPRAEEMAQSAFQQAPRNGSVVDTLGWIQVRKGKLAEGIAKLRDAVEFSESNPEIRYHLAAGLAAAGDKAEARRILNETLADAESFASRQQAEQLLASL